MALNPLNNSNLEQLALKGLNLDVVSVFPMILTFTVTPHHENIFSLAYWSHGYL